MVLIICLRLAFSHRDFILWREVIAVVRNSLGFLLKRYLRLYRDEGESKNMAEHISQRAATVLHCDAWHWDRNWNDFQGQDACGMIAVSDAMAFWYNKISKFNKSKVPILLCLKILRFSLRMLRIARRTKTEEPYCSVIWRSERDGLSRFNSYEPLRLSSHIILNLQTGRGINDLTVTYIQTS